MHLRLRTVYKAHLSSSSTSLLMIRLVRNASSFVEYRLAGESRGKKNTKTESGVRWGYIGNTKKCSFMVERQKSFLLSSN